MNINDYRCKICGRVYELLTREGKLEKEKCDCGGEFEKLFPATGCLTIKSFGKFSPCGVNTPFRYSQYDGSGTPLQRAQQSDKETFITLANDEARGKLKPAESRFWKKYFKERWGW